MIELGLKGVDEYTGWLQWNYGGSVSLDMRRKTPGDDFPSDLLRLQADGAEITDEEIAGVLYSTLFAGHETTSTFMGNYVLTMMDNRPTWEAIKADPSLIPNAVEEMLRYMPSVTLDGQPVPLQQAETEGRDDQGRDEVSAPQGQDQNDRQQDHIRTHASRCQVFLAAINHAQLNRHAAGFGIEVDADHFAKQAFVAQALGKRAADQTQTHHHQATQRRCRNGLSHGATPWPTPQGNERSQPADRWRYADKSACRSWPLAAR